MRSTPVLNRAVTVIFARRTGQCEFQWPQRRWANGRVGKSKRMAASFTHDLPSQRVVFGAGTLARLADEAERLGFQRALVIATPGSGARLGRRLAELLGARAAGLHAHAVIHVPKPVAEAGLEAARGAKADGLVAAGGGAAIGLAKIIARDLKVPILAVPTTYSGSETTTIWGTSEGERKLTGRDNRVLPRTIIYDPDLTLGLPAPVSAASAFNALAHCVGGLTVPERTLVTMAYAVEAVRRLATHLPRVVADGSDRDARGECLVASWLAGMVLGAGTGLQHKLAHVLGGLGLPHAETHAIILPHVARFNLAAPAAADARARLAEALGADHPADRIADMLRGFPIPQRLGEVGFDRGKIDFVADEVAALSINAPRHVSAGDVRALLAAAY
jgi:maleylacetate reductase